MSHRELGTIARGVRLLRRPIAPRKTGLLSDPGQNAAPLPPSFTHRQCRGAKSKTKVKLQDLPQGVLPALPAYEDVEIVAPTYPPVIQQHLNHVRKFSDCVVLTRVGNFYEMYAEQAEQYAPLLNLKVAQRRTSLGPVAMAGFQIFQLDRYLKLLVQDLNKQVAISEEIRNTPADQAKAGGLLYNRKVTRVITAGTLIDENFVDPYENNFLLSIHPSAETDVSDRVFDKSTSSQDIKRPQEVAVSWVDLSSGDFFTQLTDMTTLPSTLARISPREIVLGTSLDAIESSSLQAILRECGHFITYHNASERFSGMEDWDDVLDTPMTKHQSQSSFSVHEVKAASLLLDYVKDRLIDLKITLRAPIQRSEGESMIIDKQSLRGLEIRTTLREGLFQGSLLHSMRKTVTKSGARLLAQRLVSPSMSIDVINQRLDLVAEMMDHDILREETLGLLRRSFDTLRLLQRFSIGRGDADDLLSLAKTIEVMGHVSGVLHEHIKQYDKHHGFAGAKDWTSMLNVLNSLNLDKPNKLAKKIQDAIDEEGLSRQHEAEAEEAAQIAGFAEKVANEEDDEVAVKRSKPGKQSTSGSSGTDDGEIWIMRKNASTTLKRAHGDLENLLTDKIDLSESLRARLNSNTLTLKWTAQLGHFCHVRGKESRADIEGGRNISTSKTTRSFYLSEWTSLGVRINEAKLRIRTEEQRVFSSLRNDVIAILVKLRRNAAVLDELDVACSSATLAKERNLVRPILHSGTTHKIVGGRHPMVDIGLQARGRQFTSNDCSMTENERILLITGPNMAGKSTFLRQNALLTILAQTGCFVPADYAEIGLVDKIFSRVGSADNLYNHQSTFMVEMVEVADILNQATPRSFVIMDEVGRGTTPEDGVAVGYACLRHLHEKNQSRTLFATHFHALADMTRDLDKMGCFCTDVDEDKDGSWVYVHKLERGVNRESHALKVARLAGIPGAAIAVAEQVLQAMKVKDTKVQLSGQETEVMQLTA